MRDLDAKPDYAYDDVDYEACWSPGEVKILRMVKTYNDFVYQRYSSRPTLAHDNYTPNKKGKCLRNSQYHKAFIEIVENLEDRDPAHFISYVFELWPNRHNYHKYVFFGLEEYSGVAYPSWKAICTNWKVLVDEFLALSDFKPQSFIPLDDLGKNYREVMAWKIQQVCAEKQISVEEYWLDGEHLFPPFLYARDIKYTESLQEHAKLVEKKFGFSLEDLHEYLTAWEEAQDNARELRYQELCNLEAQGAELQFEHVITLPLEEICTQDTVDRIEYIEQEQAKGRDTTTASFERELDERFSRPDLDNRQVIMDYLYGPHNV